VFLQREEAVLSMFVVNEYTDVGRCDSCYCLDGIDCGTNGCGDFIRTEMESTVNCKAILEDDKG